MSHHQHPSTREARAAHHDEHVRLRALARQERHAAQRSLLRALRAMVQPHEPHSFHRPDVREVSPRRAYGLPAAPGGPDHTGFCPDGGIC